MPAFSFYEIDPWQTTGYRRPAGKRYIFKEQTKEQQHHHHHHHQQQQQQHQELEQEDQFRSFVMYSWTS